MTASGASARIVCCGLGPAGPEYLGPRHLEALASGPLFLRTARHLAAAPFLSGATSFDRLYEEAASFEEAYRRIAEELVGAARRHGRVVYAVPGSPLVLERTVALLREEEVELEFVTNSSFLDLAWERLGVDPVASSVRLVDGESFATAAAGERGPLLVAQLWSRHVLSEMKLALEPAPGQRAVLLHHLGHVDEQILAVDWADLDRVLEADHLTCCYIAELAEPVAYQVARAEEVVRILRERCPWDAAQSHSSLLRHLLEESYEAIEAIEALGEPPALERAEAVEEELGDVLCQVLFHSRLASEEGLFAFSDVARSLADKLVARHPHVFGEGVEDAGEVLAAWERSKLLEKGRISVMEGIPAALPALALAEKVEKKAAVLGLAAAEREAAGPHGDRALQLALDRLAGGEGDEAALGELLLGVVEVAVAAGLEGEGALRRHVGRLRDQIVRCELAAKADGVDLATLEPEARRRRFRAAGDARG